MFACNSRGGRVGKAQRVVFGTIAATTMLIELAVLSPACLRAHPHGDEIPNTEERLLHVAEEAYIRDEFEDAKSKLRLFREATQGKELPHAIESAARALEFRIARSEFAGDNSVEGCDAVAVASARYVDALTHELDHLVGVNQITGQLLVVAQTQHVLVETARKLASAGQHERAFNLMLDAEQLYEEHRSELEVIIPYERSTGLVRKSRESRAFIVNAMTPDELLPLMLTASRNWTQQDAQRGRPHFDRVVTDYLRLHPTGVKAYSALRARMDFDGIDTDVLVRALDAATEAEKNTPEWVSMEVSLGNLLHLEGQRPAALARFEDVLKRGVPAGREAELYAAIASEYEHAGKIELAVDFYRRNAVLTDEYNAASNIRRLTGKEFQREFPVESTDTHRGPARMWLVLVNLLILFPLLGLFFWRFQKPAPK